LLKLFLESSLNGHRSGKPDFEFFEQINYFAKNSVQAIKQQYHGSYLTALRSFNLMLSTLQNNLTNELKLKLKLKRNYC
jgi:hypothetical protein